MRIVTIANNDRISTQWDNIVAYMKENGRWRDKDDGSIYNKDADVSIMPITIIKQRPTKWECVLNIMPGEPITVQSIREVRRGETRHMRDQWVDPLTVHSDVQMYLGISRAFMLQDKPILGGCNKVTMDDIRKNPDITIRDTRISFKVDVSYGVNGIRVYAPCIEGADADGPDQDMEYPVKHDDLWKVIENIKNEATAMWHEWNDEEEE